MTQSANSKRLHLGFLWVSDSDMGYVGGLLVTNHMGRPLEFQCTTPVRPNKTQEILYGPTLKSFIFSDLIGKTLFERLNVKPELIIINQPSLLELRREVTVPVALINASEDSKRELPDQLQMTLGQQQLQFHADFSEDLASLSSQKKLITVDADLSEPLDRIKDALKETLRGSNAA